MTILPGLIDAHTHLTYDIEGDWVTRPVRELPADAALRGARNARRTIEAGFTTVRDVGAPGFADVSLMKAIDAGMVPGPRIMSAGYALGITGGHCDETGWAPGILERGPEEGIVDGLDAGAARRPLSAEARCEGDQDLRDGWRALVRSHRRGAAAVRRRDEGGGG